MTETHKIFNDPIHGHIELPWLCVQIIDTPVFQRLRQIKQLGATYKVYPGASHNRFEHCLGVCYLAGKFVERLRVVQRELVKARPKLDTPDFVISDTDALCLQVAGLCHDLGHGPLSHVFETYFIQKIGSEKDKKWTHEDATRMLLDYLWNDGVFTRGSVKDQLKPEDLEFIKELIKSKMTKDARKTLTGRTSEKDFLYEIISNDENSIDVDKWDYFARDCFHLGFKNNFDHNRLIQFSRLIEVDNGKRWHICYREKEVENLYHMFYSRVILHRRACLHKTTKIIEIMYMEALEKVNEHLKIKGENEEAKKISDYIRDPVAYCKLTDNIFDLIRHMDQSCNEQGNKGENSTASQPSDGLENAILKLKEQGKSDIAKMASDGEVLEAVRKLEQSENQEVERSKMASDGEVLEAVQELEQSENQEVERSQIQEIVELLRNSKRYKIQQAIQIQRAIQILDNIENRKIYKFIGEAIGLPIPADDGELKAEKDQGTSLGIAPDEKKDRPKFDKKKLREEERKVEDAIIELEIDGGKLSREDFLINILEFSYGGEGNPVDKVHFYLKSNPDKAISIKRKQVSFLLPEIYCEQVVRMYSRKLDEEKVKQCRNYFEQWCRANEMKGKWELYAAATTSSGPSQ